MANPSRVGVPRGAAHATFGNDTFVADLIGISLAGPLLNGESHMFSPLPSTLIYGQNDAVLVDRPLTIRHAKALGELDRTRR